MTKVPNHAVRLSMAAVAFFALALAGVTAFAPWLASRYCWSRGVGPEGHCAILIAYYCSCIPAAVALFCLWRLLTNIRKGAAFDPANVKLMAVLSWCSAAVAAVTCVAGIWHKPLFFITVPMAFIFLIVRVVRNCFLAAIELQQENNLTI